MNMLALDVTQEIMLVFMPVGHTHSEVDAVFGWLTQRLLQALECRDTRALEEVCFIDLCRDQLIAFFIFDCRCWKSFPLEIQKSSQKKN